MKVIRAQIQRLGKETRDRLSQMKRIQKISDIQPKPKPQPPKRKVSLVSKKSKKAVSQQPNVKGIISNI